MVNGQKAKKVSSRRNSGSTLIVVVVIAAVAALLLAAVATTVLSANAVSAQNVEANQAYFTARSAASAVENCILNYQGTDATIADKVVSNGVTSIWRNDSNMGDGSAVTTYVNTGHTKLLITGTGKYHGVTRKVSMSMLLQQQSLGIMQDIFCTPNTGLSNNGNITTTGVLSSIIALNDIHISGNLSNYDTIESANASVQIDSKGNKPITINNIYAKNGITLNGTQSAPITVKNEVKTGADLTTSYTTLSGTTQYKTNYTNNGITTSINNGPDYTPSKLPTIPDVDRSYLNGINNSILLDNNNAIAASGYVNGNELTKLQNASKNGNSVTVDTSKGDVWLWFNEDSNGSSDSTIQNINLRVAGTNNLFIYIDHGANMTLNNNFTISDTDSSKQCKTFIFGSGNPLKIDAAQVDAYIYMPNGDVTLTGNATLTGNIVGHNVTIDGGSTVNYRYPTVTGTPLEQIATDTKSMGGSSNGSWIFAGWSD